ncbi:HAMP domain-containing protein [Aliivibrio fischeri]|uniref:methyl-accepting chemotaxis protein n=1 Tax=Aliivibrio fischeri TaxID=668 RepID=UPI0012D89CC1|nr:methyl-accepting chemotaxis protein [Aliivibrio fischeri]MUK62072.1 HAMP domain-containing protein [Aliivibrio fischeri]MUL21656.1 HAMP domain-containing protein [Aliivibrio fischeri]MUL26299.1 HAMP domain-containing protein [Aliivibrio fischeri]
MNAINRFLLNIPLRYQILFPPLFAIMVMIISMLIISSAMNQSVKNSEVLNVRLQEMTHLSSSETKILQIFSEINRSLSNPETLQNVDDYVVEQIELINYDFNYIEEEHHKIKDQKHTTQQLITDLNKVSVLLENMKDIIGSNQIISKKMQTEWAKLPYLSDSIELLSKEVQDNEQHHWIEMEEALYSSSEILQIKLNSLYNFNIDKQDVEIIDAEFIKINQVIDALHDSDAKSKIQLNISNLQSIYHQFSELITNLNNNKSELFKIENSINYLIKNQSSRINEISSTLSKDSIELVFSSKQMIIISMICFTLLTMLITWITIRTIVMPIRILKDQIEFLSEGKLNELNNLIGSNEVAELCQNTDKTAHHLHQIVNALRDIASEVSTSSLSLNVLMNTNEKNILEEKSQIELIAAAVTELSAAATQVDHVAMNADERAKEALNLSRSGSDTASVSSQLSQELVKQMGLTAKEVESLKVQSEQISEVITVIDSISDQTNLLALNAAIEAARAGESGRGFAVVADEVRMLAAKTQQSTLTIQEVIDRLQSTSNDVVESVSKSIKIINETQEMTEKTNSQLLDISKEIEEITCSNTEVATAANEQNQAILSISESINLMTENINKNIDEMNNISSNADKLSELSTSQVEQLKFFTLIDKDHEK